MLISFEGIDGSGKSTQITMLRERAEKHKIKAQVFREPGGTEVSEAIRAMLLNPEADIHPVTELLLFSAARSQLISERVKPLLDENDILVILDRYYDSTVAYQGFGRGCLPIEQIHSINAAASHAHVPDLTFYLKIDLDVALQRRANTRKDRIEQAGRAFYERVCEGFDALAASEKRFVTLDATLPEAQIHDQIWQNVLRVRASG